MALFAAGALAMSCTIVRSLDDLSAGGPEVDDAADASEEIDSGPAEDDAASRESKYRAAILADEPVGYWRLGEKSGTVAKDEMGLHDGTYVGGVTLGTTATAFVDGDTAITLDGTSGEVVVGDVFGFPNKVPFSVETWIRVTVVPSLSQLIASKLDGDAASGWYVGLNSNFDGLGFGVMNGGLYSEWAFPIEANEWVHHVGTYTEDDLCVYNNGELVHCFEAGNVAGPSTAPLVFGGLGGSTQLHFRGSLDEVAIYDHELTAQRIKAHYDARSAQ